MDFANTYRVGSYGLLGARAGYTAGKWELYAEAPQPARQALRRHGGREGPGQPLEVLYPGAPRSVYVGARFQF